VAKGVTPSGRVFAAVVPPAEVVLALSDGLSSLEIPGKPVPPPNWHVTLRFVGRVDDVTYDRWLGALDQVKSRPVRIGLNGLGAFPNPPRATVLWAGVDSPGLEDLAVTIEEATRTAGSPAEERPFRPHLTLARIRPPEDVRALLERGRRMPTLSWMADTFRVMSAVGSRYVVHESFNLG